jgi:N-methylhydantoinase A/oxoprolinase/acetone carboxylase beta subunit
MCVAAKQYPSILQYLQLLCLNPPRHSRFLYEHYILIKDIDGKSRYTDDERAFCAALKSGPLPLSEAPKVIAADMYTINVSRLIKEGIVALCGFTPTDVMHIKADFNAYSTKASRLCAEIVAHNVELSVDELCDLVYRQIQQKLYQNILAVLLEIKYPQYLKNGINADIMEFIDRSFEDALAGNSDSLLRNLFQTDFAVIGIGAPIKIFLDDVARMLGTRAIIPDHFEVANALGAIAGNVSAKYSLEIRPNYTVEGIKGYSVLGADICDVFKTLKEANSYAIATATKAAEAEAVSRGATGNITVTYNETRNNPTTKYGKLYLGTTITAHAAGAVDLTSNHPDPLLTWTPET